MAMQNTIIKRLARENKTAEANGALKILRPLSPGPGAHRGFERRDVLIMCANDYQGFANHPEVVGAAVEATKRYGIGPASARFICGTLPIHEKLERQISKFLRTEAAITFSSAWAANSGLFPVIAAPGDVILSDALNHASIIDGCRLAHSDVVRDVFKHGDVEHLARLLEKYRALSGKIIATDGVFSLEGDVARLDEIAVLAERHNALLVVDDSHGLGVIGATGRGSPEYRGVLEKVAVHVGTLGKALGGGAGGFVAGPRAVIEALIQKARPHIFSNAVPPGIAAAASKAIELIDQNPALIGGLRQKVNLFRQQLSRHGLKPLPGEAAIVPVMIGDSEKAVRISTALLQAGVFATSFAFPVVPDGQARIRFQISQSHAPEELTWSAEIVGQIVAAAG